MLLQDHQLNEDVKKALAVTFRINKTIDKGVDDEDVDEEGVDAIVDENEEIIDIKEFSNKFSGTNNPFSTPSQQIIFEPIGDRKSGNDKTKKLLEELFEKAYKNDEVVKEIINAKACDLRKLPTVLTKKGIVLSMEDLKIESEQLYVKNRMYVSENKLLQLFLLEQHYDSPIHGHPGYKAMYQKIQANYFWFDMAKHCKQYASNCLTCRCTKAYTVQKQGLLNPLLIPNRKWMDLSLDFVVKLLKCCRRNRVFQYILMVMNWLTKQRLYEPLETLHTGKFINATYCRVFASYRFPLITVNDWGGQMTATIWRQLCKRYSLNIKFFSAHYPKTDGQTKSANRIMKNYLWAYIAYTQDN